LDDEASKLMGPLAAGSGERRKLYDSIAKFYDNSEFLWEQTWGEHMHHGYYGKDGSAKKDHVQAQIDLIEEALTFANIKKPKTIVDVGCCIGGSSRYLARKYGAKVTGINLSTVHVNRAKTITKEQGLENQCEYIVGDALKMPFPDNSFDLAYSMESGEHMPDKDQFVQECVRVLKPGGTFLLVAWCHREEPPPLSADEMTLLNRIYKVYELPYMCPLSEFCTSAIRSGLVKVKSDDWSKSVAPFWKAVVISAFSISTMIKLLLSGYKTIRGALAMLLMIIGFQRKIIIFGIMSGDKKEHS